MGEEVQIAINNKLDEVLSFVDNTKYPVKAKELMRYMVVYDFQDMLQFDEESNNYTYEEYMAAPLNPKYNNVVTTKGIINLKQLERWIRNFVDLLKTIRINAIYTHLEILDKLPPAEKAQKLSTQLNYITRKEILAKHGMYDIIDPDFYEQLKEIYGNELEFASKQAEIENFKHQPNTIKKIENILKSNTDDSFTMENKDNQDNAPQPVEKVKMRDFNTYMKELQYNYPIKYPPFDLRDITKDYLIYLKKEILDNLINLANDDRKPYLNRLKYELEERQNHAWAKREDLDEWFKKYNITEEQVNTEQDYKNELFLMLSNDPPKFKETFEEDFNKDTEQVQMVFYNYYYGQALQNALDFIQLQAAEYSIPTVQAPTVIEKEIHYKDTSNAPHSIDVIDFFEKIESGEIVQLQIVNTVEKITDNFNIEKLKILYADFEFYLFNSKENKEAEYSFEDVQTAMDEFSKNGKEIPYTIVPELTKTPEGKVQRGPETSKFIDKEKLLYPYDFFLCYQFKNYLVKEINTRAKPPEPPAKTVTTGKHQSFKYIGKIGEQEKINYLFEDLKKSNFIAQDTELKYFKKIFSGNAIEKAIVWTGNISELYYFIKQLHNEQKKVENVKQEHWKIAILCFVKPDGKPFDFKKLKSQKDPSTTKAIDKIVKAL